VSASPLKLRTMGFLIVQFISGFLVMAALEFTMLGANIFLTI
jgi:hypothetical protein